MTEAGENGGEDEGRDDGTYRDQGESLLASEKYENRLDRLAVERKRRLVVDYFDIYDVDMSIALELPENPEPILKGFSTIAEAKLRIRRPDYYTELADLNERPNQPVIKISVKNLPPEFESSIRTVEPEQLGKLIAVTGIVVSVTKPEPKLVNGVFQCKDCGERYRKPQHPADQFIESPKVCMACQGHRFRVLPKESASINTQWVKLQELPEELPPGQLPRNARILLKGGLVDTVDPGDRVRATCIASARQESKNSRIFYDYLEANYMERIGSGTEALEITLEDEKAIKKLSEEEDLLGKITGSVAPILYGLDHLKKAVSYQLFGGVVKEFQDQRVRGDIHILLVGDPGTGKSQLLQHASTIAPRGLFTTGRGSTAAGLTAAVIKEEGGNFALEAGALVLSDQGLCAIDELDKMDSGDRRAIHPALAQQIVPISKGGINATLNSRCSVLAAANPALGRYNPYQNIKENINLPITLLNRFDLIFILRDIPDVDRDKETAEYVLKTYSDPESIQPPIEAPLLRKYISYARRRVNPRITEEVEERLKSFYYKMRSASAEDMDSAIMITTRHLEALTRLTEARAKMELREETTLQDAEEAIQLMKKSLEQVGLDPESGEIDMDIIYTGKSRTMQEQLQTVISIITEKMRANENKPIHEDDLIEELRNNKKIRNDKIPKLLSTLKREKTIYEPRPRHYKV